MALLIIPALSLGCSTCLERSTKEPSDSGCFGHGCHYGNSCCHDVGFVSSMQSFFEILKKNHTLQNQKSAVLYSVCVIFVSLSIHRIQRCQSVYAISSFVCDRLTLHHSPYAQIFQREAATVL